jgi:hypothetical protein
LALLDGGFILVESGSSTLIPRVACLLLDVVLFAEHEIGFVVVQELAPVLILVSCVMLATGHFSWFGGEEKDDDGW